MMKKMTGHQKAAAAIRPAYLPFQTSADIQAFDFATDEAYTELVSIDIKHPCPTWFLIIRVFLRLTISPA